METLATPGTNFWLTSSDNPEMNATPRSCTVVARVERSEGWVHVSAQDDALLVSVQPPLSEGTENFEIVVLAPRHFGFPLVTPREYPVYVYVLQPLIQNPVEFREITRDNARILAWGDVYETETQARGAFYAPLHEDDEEIRRRFQSGTDGEFV